MAEEKEGMNDRMALGHVGKINIAVVKIDVNLWRGEVMLLYQALWRAHAECTTLFRYSAQKMNSQ